MKQKLKYLYTKIAQHKAYIITVLILSILSFGLVGLFIGYFNYQNNLLYSKITSLTASKTELESEISTLKNQDQVKVNEDLKREISEIKSIFTASLSTYESILNLRAQKKDTAKFDKLYANILSLLSKFDYKSAKEKLTSLDTEVSKETQVAVVVGATGSPPPVNNAPPGSGYSRQSVQTANGSFVVSLIAANLSSTKIIVDTASDSDCANDCPSFPLATYVSRSGAYAGITGAYACPPEYPSCAGKTNSFDLLIMNKNKVYFNSNNNVYSNNPAVIFGGSYIRFVTAASQWGRDTGIDSMLSNFPLLVFNSQKTYSGNPDPKFNSRSYRGFVANKGNDVYIGYVHSATIEESAIVLQTLGMQNAINLDGGGSTALWSGGYKLGPGRNITNSILFLRK